MKTIYLPESLKNSPPSVRMLWQSAFKSFPNIAKEQYEKWIDNNKKEGIASFMPNRVIAQDFTGVPLVVDLATLRSEAVKRGIDFNKINPLIDIDLIIDHSVIVDSYGSEESMKINLKNEFSRNYDRYKFLKWAQSSFDKLRLVPPGKGICHQMNIEFITKIIDQKDGFYYSDSCIGTDSHTTMAGALGILAWGVGGIEAEAAMLGISLDMVIPPVIGFKMTGSLSPGVTATDLVITITNLIRQHGAVGKFVEFYGSGTSSLPLEHRATISNMAPEYGATCGLFHVDEMTYNYLYNTGRDKELIDQIKEYIETSNIYQTSDDLYDEHISLDLSTVRTSLAGPSRPQDLVYVEDMHKIIPQDNPREPDENGISLRNGDVAIAAITSCTNTSNSFLMIHAGLLAKKACELGLKVKSHVKTSFAPGSRVVKQYLESLDLMKHLSELGFNIVGYGCTTCIGNSGDLAPGVEEYASKNNVELASVLSGNRNFQGRVHSKVRSNFLASPPLVVAYALLGNINIDITKEAIGNDKNGNLVYLKDIWPSQEDVSKSMSLLKVRDFYIAEKSSMYVGDENWENIYSKSSEIYSWDENNTYIKKLSIFEQGIDNTVDSESYYIKQANALLLLGDSITTDHISPAGKIMSESVAGKYLTSLGETVFNSYGSRRGNHEIMIRGTFANVRLFNQLVNKEGPYTLNVNTKEIGYVYDIAMDYAKQNIPLIVIAGEQYGTGSSRDWAAKGTRLLGIRAVVVKSFERIHRSNLVGMGVLPLSFVNPDDKETITGFEKFDIKGKPEVNGRVILFADNREIQCNVCIYTKFELDVFTSGGMLNYFIDNIESMK